MNYTKQNGLFWQFNRNSETVVRHYTETDKIDWDRIIKDIERLRTDEFEKEYLKREKLEEDAHLDLIAEFGGDEYE